MHIYAIWEDITDEFIGRAEMETQTKRMTCEHGGRGVWWEGESGINWGSMGTYTVPYVKQIASGHLLYASWS